MKRIINEEEFKKVHKDLQGEYKKEGDSYVLNLEDWEDPAELKRAKDRVKEELNKEKASKKDLQTELEKIQTAHEELLKGNVPKANLEQLENSYKTKLEKLTKDSSELLAAKNKQLTDILVDGEAMKIAGKISIAPAVILPHIKGRIKAEEVEGKLVTRILDSNGQLSAASLQDLEKEFLANKDFAPIIRASNASGGGAGGGSGGGSATTGKSMKREAFEALPEADRKTFMREGGKLVS